MLSIDFVTPERSEWSRTHRAFGGRINPADMTCFARKTAIRYDAPQDAQKYGACAMSQADSTVFQIERHGETTIIRPAAAIESIRWDLIEQAAEVVLQPIRRQECPLVIVAL